VNNAGGWRYWERDCVDTMRVNSWGLDESMDEFYCLV
jgi:hypothetical protein